MDLTKDNFRLGREIEILTNKEAFVDIEGKTGTIILRDESYYNNIIGYFSIPGETYVVRVDGKLYRLGFYDGINCKLAEGSIKIENKYRGKRSNAVEIINLAYRKQLSDIERAKVNFGKVIATFEKLNIIEDNRIIKESLALLRTDLEMIKEQHITLQKGIAGSV